MGAQAGGQRDDALRRQDGLVRQALAAGVVELAPQVAGAGGTAGHRQALGGDAGEEHPHGEQRRQGQGPARQTLAPEQHHR